jgi:hypothetical protein
MSLYASPRENGAFSLLGDFVICNPEPRHHGCPEGGRGKMGEGMEEAVVEDFWVYLRGEGRARITVI